MKIVRTPVLKETKKLLVAMIIISVFMFITSMFNLYLYFGNGLSIGIKSVAQTTSENQVAAIISSALPTILSIIAITWGVCAALLLKTKKLIFAKMPSYVICAILVMAFILYYISSGDDNVVLKLLLFSVVILAVYPHIIATLTLEGRLYNRVFATIFTSVLIAVSLIIPIAECVIGYTFGVTSLFPA